MHKYFAYGLKIHSDIELPLWPADKATELEIPDINIVIGKSRPLCRDLPKRGYEFDICSESGEIRSLHVGSVLITPGMPVRVESTPLPGSTQSLLACFLSGSALSLAIFYHGFLPLHGCSLRVNGKIVIFLGLSGTGKSSLCAALCKMGHQIISDDISPVCWIDGRAHVLPGYPQLKIYPDTANAIGVPRSELSVLHEIHPKAGWFRPENRFYQPQPIDSIFFLGTGRREIQPLTRFEALSLIQRHATPSQWGFEGGRAHFLACTRLICDLQVFSLKRERNLDGLMEQAKWIEQHLEVALVPSAEHRNNASPDLIGHCLLSSTRAQGHWQGASLL